MEQFLDFLTKQVKPRWSSRSALALALVTGGSAALLFVSEVELGSLTWIDYAIVALVLIAIATVWHLTNRAPKAKKGRIGFVIAITTEKESHAKRLRSDFVAKIRELLIQVPSLYGFDLIEYSQGQSEKVTPETAERYLLKSNARFMIYGRARIRKVGGEKYHVLNLEGAVGHAALGPKTAQALSKEFREVFPRVLQIQKEIDLFGFEVTAALMDMIARYIVGIAAMVSGDLKYAEELFTDLRSRSDPSTAAIPAVVKIRQRVPTRLREVYNIQMREAVKDNQHDKQHLMQADEVLKKIERLGRLDYSQTLMKAMCEFFLRRNVRKAKRLLRNCQGNPDATWRYSLAFLYAYTGDIRKARRLYGKAFHSPHLDSTVPIQTEEFIRQVLDEEPGRIQLLYCLGLINYFVKSDMASAVRDFKEFLAKPGRDELSVARAEALTLVERAEANLAENAAP